MLMERNETQKAMCCMILFTQNVPYRQSIEMESRLVVAGVRRRGNWEWPLMGTRVFEG